MNTWIQIHLATFCAASVRSLLQVLNFSTSFLVLAHLKAGQKFLPFSQHFFLGGGNPSGVHLF